MKDFTFDLTLVKVRLCRPYTIKKATYAISFLPKILKFEIICR